MCYYWTNYGLCNRSILLSPHPSTKKFVTPGQAMVRKAEGGISRIELVTVRLWLSSMVYRWIKLVLQVIGSPTRLSLSMSRIHGVTSGQHRAVGRKQEKIQSCMEDPRKHG